MWSSLSSVSSSRHQYARGLGAGARGNTVRVLSLLKDINSLILISYIHALNIALDANFRLKRKDVSNDQADPGLSHGFAYFVEEKNFKSFLDAHMDEVEPKSTCSRHDAVNLADSRPGQGYSSSGVATVECARHNMKRPGGVGDLQRGER